MTRSVFLLFVSLSLIGLVVSCGDHRSEVASLKERVSKLETENVGLKEQVRELQETDQSYFNSAMELLSSHRFEEAAAKLEELGRKFPTSPLIGEASKKRNEIKREMDKALAQEKKTLDSLLGRADKQDVEVAIRELQTYTAGKHSAELLARAQKKLQTYKAQFEKVKAERQVEKSTGVRIVSVTSQWAWRGTLGDMLFCPQLKVDIKNVSDSDIGSIVVKATFLDVGKNEVFGDASSYLVGFGDAPLRPGYTKTAFLYCSVGYTSDIVMYNLPNLMAEIYVNGNLFKKVRVSEEYGG